jgi:hypothetical protein
VVAQIQGSLEPDHPQWAIALEIYAAVLRRICPGDFHAGLLEARARAIRAACGEEPLAGA